MESENTDVGIDNWKNAPAPYYAHQHGYYQDPRAYAHFQQPFYQLPNSNMPQSPVRPRHRGSRTPGRATPSRVVRVQSSAYKPRRVNSKGSRQTNQNPRSVNAAGASTPNLWNRGAPNTKSDGHTISSKPKQNLRTKGAAGPSGATTPSTSKARDSVAGKSAPPSLRGKLEQSPPSPVVVRKKTTVTEASAAHVPVSAAPHSKKTQFRPPLRLQPSDEQGPTNFCVSPVVTRGRNFNAPLPSPGRKAAVPLLNPRKNSYVRELRNNGGRGRASPRHWDNKGGWDRDRGRGGGRGRGRGRGGRGPHGGRHSHGGRHNGRGRGRSRHHTPLVADRDAVLPTWWIVSQKGTIKVRKSPNTRSPMVGNMPRGTKCRVVGSKQMEYQGKGYTRLHVKGRGFDAMSGKEIDIEGWVTEVLFNGKILLVKEQSNKWSRDTFQQEQQTDALKQVKAKTKIMLNKLSDANFNRLVPQFLALPIVTKPILAAVAELIFENAIKMPMWCALYSRLCLELTKQSEFLCNKIVTISPDTGIPATDWELKTTDADGNPSEPYFVSKSTEQSTLDDDVAPKLRFFCDVGHDTREEGREGPFKTYAEAMQQGRRLCGFRRVLLDRTRQVFEAQTSWEAAVKDVTVDPSSEATIEQKRAQMDAEENRLKLKDKALGIAQFVGQLYLVGLLRQDRVHLCIADLHRRITRELPDSVEGVEVLLKIVSEVGAAVDGTEAGRKKMDEYFAILEEIKSTKGLESRTRFMIMDVFDLRKKYNWVKPKRRGF